MILKRRPKVKMGLRTSTVIRCPGHLKFVRKLECCISRASVCCDGRIEAHHVQSFHRTEGGMGMKVGDDKAVPLCALHHVLIHAIGQAALEVSYRLDLEVMAADLWRADTYHRLKYEREHS